MNAGELARLFKVLSAPTRVRIVQLLHNRVLCVGALSTRLGVTQGAVSQHLRILRDAGLVEAERRGYYIHYRINSKTLAKWRPEIEQLLTPTPDSAGRRSQKKGDNLCARRPNVRNRRS